MGEYVDKFKAWLKRNFYEEIGEGENFDNWFESEMYKEEIDIVEDEKADEEEYNEEDEVEVDPLAWLEEDEEEDEEDYEEDDGEVNFLDWFEKEFYGGKEADKEEIDIEEVNIR